MSLGRSGPGVRSGFLETPRTRFGGVFLASLADSVPVGCSWGFEASRPKPVRGSGCRSRVVRLSVPERLPGRHGPARTLPSRSAGHGRERRAVVRAVRHAVWSNTGVRIFRIGPGSRTGCPQQPEVANSAKARDGFALVKQSEGNEPDVAAAVRARKRKLKRREVDDAVRSRSRGLAAATGSDPVGRLMSRQHVAACFCM